MFTLKDKYVTVLLEPLDLPDIGRLAVLQDPAGASFQVMASASPPS